MKSTFLTREEGFLVVIIMITGSEALMQALIHEGVDTVFGYPGGSIMPVFDAMFDHQNDFKQVLVRHEQGAAHAAQG